MKKLICFDLDDTLIYSDKCHLTAYDYALKEFKIKIKKPKFMVSLFGMPHRRLIEIIAPELSKEQIEKTAKVHDYLLIKKTYKYAKQIPGAIKTLEILKKNYENRQRFIKESL